MSILIGYESALDYWRTVGPEFLRDHKARQEATGRAQRVLAAQEKPRLLGGNRRPAGCSLPVRALVKDARCRTSTSSVVTHIWPNPPVRSFVDAGEGFLISTPEFCFLQMANRLTLGCLIQLGFELCGTYTLVEHGPAQRRDKPLTTVPKLKSFLDSASNTRGRNRALRGTRYLIEGSASPMETILTMLLCLPYNIGGYGLPHPMLNYRVDIPNRSRRLADRTYCSCDLCWPYENLVLEYDSALYHSDPQRRESDARRRNTLITLGFTVITVSSDQLMNSGAFNRLAHQVAKRLGKRLRYKDPHFTHTHCDLRDELFSAIGILRGMEADEPSRAEHVAKYVRQIVEPIHPL